MYLRKATFEDSELLLDWANDPIVRQNSFNTQTISREEHYAWLKNVLNSFKTDIYILYDEQSIGTVRIKYKDNFAEISYSICAEHRGKGYGTHIIKLAEFEIIKHNTVDYILAEVKKENLASRRIFNKLGYNESTCADYIKFIKLLQNIVGFRVDANKYVASGHAMRCITYAKELMKKGGIVLFFVSDNESKEFLESRGMYVVVLGSCYDKLEDELPIIIDLIKKHNLTSIIIDSYYVTFRYLSRIKSVVKTVYIDDVLAFAYPVDTVINYSLYADKKEYEKLYGGNCPELFLGIKYAPLRKEFKKVNYKVRDSVSKILITTGGGDQYGVAKTIVEYLLSFKEFLGIELNVVSGEFAEDVSYGTIVAIHKNVNNMAQLMTECDLLISSGGFTLYEACAVGIPTLTISFAENQTRNVTSFNNKGIIPYCGNILNEKSETLKTLSDYIYEFMGNYNARIVMSECMKNLFLG